MWLHDMWYWNSWLPSEAEVIQILEASKVAPWDIEAFLKKYRALLAKKTGTILDPQRYYDDKAMWPQDISKPEISPTIEPKYPEINPLLDNKDYIKSILPNENFENIRLSENKIYNYFQDYQNNFIKTVKVNNTWVNALLAPGVMVTADTIAGSVFPLVEYAAMTRPDCIIACDRWARPIWVAAQRLYQWVFWKLPTFDGKVNFKRISKSNPYEMTREHLRPLIENVLKTNPNPTILILDDWVVSWTTRQIVERCCKDIARWRWNITVKFWVLQWQWWDISWNPGHAWLNAWTVSWHDNGDMIGIDYDGVTPKYVDTDVSKNFYERLLRSCDTYAADMLLRKSS